LNVPSKLLYSWKKRVDEGGRENVEGKVGRPPKSTGERREEQKRSDRERIAHLERLVGKQQALIDFFEKALQAPETLDTSEAGKAPSSKSSGNKGKNTVS
jgi:hypothetical protein